jgi:hypothetical protein
MIRILIISGSLLIGLVLSIGLAVYVGHRSDDCVARGGHEVFQGYAGPRDAGVVLVPIYRCVGAR